MKKEEWKSIPNYEGLYEVSSYGRVKSLRKNLILKPIKNYGYYKVSLGKYDKHKIHKLVAQSFLDLENCEMGLVIDHINNDKLDNRVENLQLISQRENASKDKKNTTSNYPGVNWFKLRNKWRAAIGINGKTFHLGLFTDEYEAHLAYQNKLNSL